MRIAGLERCSLIDYPGKIAAVVFTPGCNLDCFYCHNRTLLTPSTTFGAIPLVNVLDWLRKRQGLLDAVVISGGEPTLQLGLADFIREVRAMDYAIKLDTNGTQPAILALLMDEGLLDYVAMDIKAPPEKYESICGVSMDHDAIDACLNMLLYGHVDYEFRTTSIPQLTKTDILTIGQHIRGARRYVLQQYRRPKPHLGFSDPRLNEAPHPANWVLDILTELESLAPHSTTRGFDTNRRQWTEILSPILPP